jgi:hypothetical protein
MQLDLHSFLPVRCPSLCIACAFTKGYCASENKMLAALRCCSSPVRLFYKRDGKYLEG